MEISIYHKTFKVILSPMARILFVAGVLLSACADSEQTSSPVPDHTATLQLVFKQQGPATESSPTQLKGTDSFSTDTPLTVYADAPLTMDVGGVTRTPMTRAGLEDDIKTVDVLSFKVDPSDPTNMTAGTFFYRVRGRYETSGGQGYVRVQLVSSAEKQTLVVLVNARKQVEGLGAFYGEMRELVMRRLTLSSDATTSQININPADGMPMWGELTAQSVDGNYAQTQSTAPVVTLERMVAKVTFKVGVEHIYALHYYHGYDAGRIVPNNTAGMPTVDPWNITTRPYVDYSPATSSFGDASFFLFESDNRTKASDNKLSNSFFTIKASNFQAGSFWYRVDLMNYNTGEYYDILRNRHYVIEMTNGGTINTPGAATEEEAIRGSYRFKCRIVPWNEVREEVVVPGNKRLTVDKRSIRLSGASAATTGKTLTVTTENTGGWTITDIPSWLTVSPTSSTTDGTGVITVKSRGTDAINNGTFKLKAGNAQMDIKVKLGKLPLEYVAEYNLAGGFQYGSSFNPFRTAYSPTGVITPTTAQTDNALRWATNHNNDQSGYYNWYVLKGITQGTYNPAGKNLFNDSFFTTGAGKGYHLPSLQELTGVFAYSSVNNYNPSGADYNTNEAIEFGGVKKTFGADYRSSRRPRICYALRFKKATGSPINDGSSLLSDFPQATDNSMLCAYRYTIVGSFLNTQNLTSHLKVECVYLGEARASIPISTISNDSWWNARASETVTRIFPATGSIWPALVSGSSGKLGLRGYHGYYWSGTERRYDSYSHHAFFNDYRANSYGESSTTKGSGFAVRLFARE
ncbi:hypothetical protein AB9N12_08025 [Bacteroides sp. AN502(2024)]|uniref:hypothetical protein n=1 Tax=Bacteroides sp. AN502(2024) TaxID=3160599 RepID=UPI0035176DAC